MPTDLTRDLARVLTAPRQAGQPTVGAVWAVGMVTATNPVEVDGGPAVAGYGYSPAVGHRVAYLPGGSGPVLIVTRLP